MEWTFANVLRVLFPVKLYLNDTRASFMTQITKCCLKPVALIYKSCQISSDYINLGISCKIIDKTNTCLHGPTLYELWQVFNWVFSSQYQHLFHEICLSLLGFIMMQHIGTECPLSGLKFSSAETGMGVTYRP